MFTENEYALIKQGVCDAGFIFQLPAQDQTFFQDGARIYAKIAQRQEVADDAQGARAKTRRNALTSPYLWLLSLTAIIPATLFWQHKWVLVGFGVLFVAGYTWLYAQIVRFNAPQWMILRKKK